MTAAITANTPFDLEEVPRLPLAPRRYGIGVVGAGSVVEASHLPAYRQAGFRVEAIFDLAAERATRLAEAFGVPRVCRSLDELLGSPDIDIVDIAVPAVAQPDIASRALNAGKHVLCQKPFAETYAAAARVVEEAENAGLTVAVNQNMRYAPSMSAVRTLRRRGWLGELLNGEIQVNVHTPWDRWEWLLDRERLEIMYHSIHYLDAVRAVLGDPVAAYCQGQRTPDQRALGETRTTTVLEYPDARWGLVRVEHGNRNDRGDWCSAFRFDGTKGTAKGTFSPRVHYPDGRPDTITYRAADVAPDAWVIPTLRGEWRLAGFIGTMAELMRALEEGTEPPHSGRDNLATLQLLFACYRSMAEHRPITLAEIAR